MKITFFSNYLNHHQVPFSNEMVELLGDGYKFVATEPMESDRLGLGWEMAEPYPFELRSYQSQSALEQCMLLGLSSDVVIIGSAPEIFIKERLKQNKLTFRYSERIFKQGTWRIISPRAVLSLLNAHTRYRNRNLYLLCASAYTKRDFSLVGAYPRKAFKWGYFPELSDIEPATLLSSKRNDTVKLLWCGRFLDWKHPEKAVMIMQQLKENGFSCSLDFIGDGPICPDIKAMVRKRGLDGMVRFLGSMAPTAVRPHMDRADIYLFTSNRQEGWGAVLNEAMNSACAVVASNEAGSTPYLVRDSINGLIYYNNNTKELYSKVELLVKDKKLREGLGKNAAETTQKTWNPKVAANHLVQLCRGLLSGKPVEFDEGPCSRA